MADKPSYLTTSAGPTFARGDTAFVRDRSGNIKTVSSSDAARLLDEDPEYFPVTAEQVGARDVEIARSTLGEKAKTLGEAALSTAIDVPLAVGRTAARIGGANEKDLKYFTGRTAVGEGVGKVQDALSGQMDDTARDERRAAYEQASRERANINPNTATAGEIIGTLPWAAVGPGAAAEAVAARTGMGLLGRTALRTGAGALEGAILGESAATEDAYIEDKPLTAEKVMAAMGWGALIGGGASFGLSVAGDLAGAAGSRLRGAGRARADDALEEVAAARAAAPDGTAPPRFADPTEQRLGEAAEAAGANPAARKAAAQDEARRIVAEAKVNPPTPGDWKNYTQQATPEALYVHRAKVLDMAAEDTANELTRVVKNSRSIQDEIDNLGLKRDKVAAHMAADGVDDTAALATAQAEVTGAAQRSAELRAQLQARRDEIAGGGPLTKDKAKGRAKMSSAEQALNEFDTIAAEANRRLAAAETGADGVIALDWMRREQSRVMRGAVSSARRVGGYEARTLLEPTVDFLRAEYLRTAEDLLMNPAVVGKTQAAAQSVVNRARASLIDSGKFDLKPFLNQVADEQSEMFGRQAWAGNRDTIRGMLDQITPDGGRLRTEQFERFLKNQDEFNQALRVSYDLSPKNVAALEEQLASTRSLQSTLDTAREAAAKTAKVEAKIAADRVAGGTVGRMLAGAAYGAGEGGLTGALQGAARGAFGGTEATLQLQAALSGIAESTENKLATWLADMVGKVAGTEGAGASAVNATAKAMDSRVDSSLDRFFNRIAGKAKPGGGAARVNARGEATSAGNRDAAKRAAIPAAIRMFAPGGNLREAYDERVEELRMANRDMGAGVRDGVTASLGGLAQSAPELAGHLAAAGTRGSLYLEQHLPVGTRSPTAFQPNRKAAISDMALRSFARRWAAVNNPMTAVEDMQRGQLTYDQVDALKNVYPALYNGLRMKTLMKLQQLDQAGVVVPYQDRLQLNLLLDLHGAGDVTLTTDFALKVSGMSQAQKAQQKRPKSGGAPVKLAASRESGSQEIGATLRGA